MAADIEVAFDRQALRVTGCAPGAAIGQPAGFECRYNMPGLLGSAQVSYVSLGHSAGIEHEAEVRGPAGNGAAGQLDGGGRRQAGLAEIAWLTFQVPLAPSRHITCFMLLSVAVFVNS